MMEGDNSFWGIAHRWGRETKLIGYEVERKEFDGH